VILAVIVGGVISEEATVLSVLMKVYIILCRDRGHINVILVLQSCANSLQVMAGSSNETFATSSDDMYDVGNMKVEEDIDVKEEEEEVNVEREKGICSEGEENMVVKDENGIFSEGEKVELEDIFTKEEEKVDIKEEVS
jgi:hypothetical protein